MGFTWSTINFGERSLMSDIWAHLDLVELHARRMGIDSSLVADLGLEALRQASTTYDPNRGVAFRTYASVVVRNAIASFKRSEVAMDQLYEDANIAHAPESFRQTAHADVKLFDEVRSKLTDEEYELLQDRYVRGKSMELIGQELGFPRGTIWARIKRILKKIQVWTW